MFPDVRGRIILQTLQIEWELLVPHGGSESRKHQKSSRNNINKTEKLGHVLVSAVTPTQVSSSVDAGGKPSAPTVQNRFAAVLVQAHPQKPPKKKSFISHGYSAREKMYRRSSFCLFSLGHVHISICWLNLLFSSGYFYVNIINTLSVSKSNWLFSSRMISWSSTLLPRSPEPDPNASAETRPATCWSSW